MNLRTRKILLSLLVSAFLIQTALVYFDTVHQKNPPLSASAQEGQSIWLSNNCQTCHQIYGFGGFLGPDLTNAAQRLSDSRLQSILTDGSAQMPAYHFNKEQQASLLQFFKEIDNTGRGVPRMDTEKSSDPVLRFYESIKEDIELTAHEKEGFEVFQNYACISCHLPNTKSVYKAPDLSLLTERLDKEFISKVLVEGRIEKGMPPFHFSEEKRDAVYAFLKTLNTHRESVLKRYHSEFKILSFELMKKLPWFEYE